MKIPHVLVTVSLLLVSINANPTLSTTLVLRTGDPTMTMLPLLLFFLAQ